MKVTQKGGGGIMGNVHRNTHCFNLEQKCSITYLEKNVTVVCMECSLDADISTIIPEQILDEV